MYTYNGDYICVRVFRISVFTRLNSLPSGVAGHAEDRHDI